MVGRLARVALPAALLLFVAVGVAQRGLGAAEVVIATVVVIVGAVLFAAADVSGWPLFGGGLVVGAAITVIGNGQSSSLVWFGLCVLGAWLGQRASAYAAATFVVLTTATFVVEGLFIDPDPGWGPWTAGVIVSTVAAYLGRRQVLLLEELRAAQAELAERARTEERNRIAREVHDVIGHALTVSLLHVTSARLAIEDEPDEAARQLDEAERLGRESLTEVRRTVGLMRRDDGTEDAGAPMPGAENVAALIESVRRTGTPVTVEVNGDPQRLGAAEGLTVYRILQEALTNVARHAPGCATRVHIDYAADATRLRVDSSGPAAADYRAGMGLINMRERVEGLAGTFSAGPTSSGWLVEAELPR